MEMRKGIRKILDADTYLYQITFKLWKTNSENSSDLYSNHLYSTNKHVSIIYASGWQENLDTYERHVKNIFIVLERLSSFRS